MPDTTHLSPRAIVAELDRNIVGPADAKRAAPWRCATAGAGPEAQR